MKKGKFIVFEGLDGAGQGTQIKHIHFLIFRLEILLKQFDLRSLTSAIQTLKDNDYRSSWMIWSQQ